MGTAVVAAEAEVVLAEPPTEGLGDGDGLGEREVGLLLIESGELAKGNAGQAVIKRVGIERGAIRP